jgi:D-alanyl-D-alanine carboxypeptidase
MRRNIILTTLTLTIVSFGFSQTPPANIVNGIDSLFQKHVNNNMGFFPGHESETGHVIRVEKNGNWVYSNSAGLASLSPLVNTQPEMKFKIASITKLFTTAAIFKLIQNGQINFNAPISTYLPPSVAQGFAGNQFITIKKLLSHTSGIAEPQLDFQGRLNYWIYMKRFQNIPIDSLIFWSYANSHGIGDYKYSNANFYLLAEIIEAVSGITYQDYITNYIITPLGLTNTDFNTIPTGSFMRGYLLGSFYGNHMVLPQNIGLKPDSLYDFTEASNSWGYGAADIWSNTTDLIKFHKALFGGQIINANWLETMKTVVTNTGDMGSYGHGMIQFKSFNGGPIYAYGHTGTAFGYGSMLCYIPSLDIYMCSAGNYMKIGQEFLQRDIYNFLNNNITSISETDLNNAISIYPNPTSNILNINTTLQNFQVSVYSLTGQLILDKKNSYTLDVSSLSTGLYVFKLQDLNSMTTITKKFIRE